MIYELHKIDAHNIGDHYCNPGRYFDFQDLITEDLRSKTFNAAGKNIIVGGGGLIHKTFDQHVQRLLDQRPRFSAAWGIGHNYGPAVQNKGRPFLFPEYLNKFNLLGVRDWIPGSENTYLPCVTCMHPAFDRSYTTKHPVVFYLHDTKSTAISIESGSPVKTNSEMDMYQVIDFLASGETVVTNSYHGAYWSLLLGKKVITTAWSIKFNYFKYPPTIADSLDRWQEYTGSSADPDYLNESRDLNKAFYKQILNAI